MCLFEPLLTKIRALLTTESVLLGRKCVKKVKDLNQCQLLVECDAICEAVDSFSKCRIYGFLK